MNSILKLLGTKQLVKLLLDIAKIVAQKTKTTKDDEVINTLYEVFEIIEPLIPQKKK